MSGRSVDVDSRAIRINGRSVGVGSAIPDSVGYQYFTTEQDYSDGAVVGPFEDSASPFVNLTSNGSPTLNAGSLNSVDAIDLDGSDDEYDYDYSGSPISEPCTLLFALHQNPTNRIETLLDNPSTNCRIQNQVDNNRWFFNITGKRSFGSSPNNTGDLVVSISISASDGADLRVNGTVKESVGASNISNDATILNTGTFMGEGGSRFVTGLWGGAVIHPDDALSGSSLTDEEARVESEFNMGVL